MENISTSNAFTETSCIYHWRIDNFMDFINTRKTCIESSLIQFKCIHTTFWTLTLNISFTKDNYRISIYLERLDLLDELNGLHAKFKMFSENQNVHCHGETRLQHIPREKGKFKMPISFNKTNLSRYLDNGNLKLILEFHVYTEYVETVKWNFNLELKDLSNDMRNLYYSDDLKELTIMVESEVFNVHKCILQARWPKFSKYERLYPENLINTSPTIHAKSLVEVVTKYNAPHSLSEKDLNEKKSDMVHIFTANLARFFLYYVYTGLFKNIPSKEMPNLIRLGRFFHFKTMLQKLEENPSAILGITTIRQECHSIEWDNKDTEQWIRSSFRPVIYKIQPHNLCAGPLEVNIKINEESKEIDVSLCLLEPECLNYLKCSIRVRNEDNVEIHAAINAEADFYDKSLIVSTGINKCEIERRTFTIDVTIQKGFMIRNEIKEFSLMSDELESNPSLHFYSEDFNKFFLNQKMNDAVLFTAENKIVNAHKYILCARSMKFHKDLIKKLTHGTVISYSATDVPYEIMYRMLNCLYSGRMHIDPAVCQEQLWKLSYRYNFAALMNSIKKRTTNIF